MRSKLAVEERALACVSMTSVCIDYVGTAVRLNVGQLSLRAYRLHNSRVPKVGGVGRLTIRHRQLEGAFIRMEAQPFW